MTFFLTEHNQAMTLDPRRRRAHDKLAATPGVTSVRRPITDGGADEFDLYYVRSGQRSRSPLVIIPGGPGMASIGHYGGLRRRAAAAGLDVIMIEHRGVGLSRHLDTGADLPAAAMTMHQVVDDVAAVLDDAGVQTATVYGTSYGSYVAAGVGVRHPGRVEAMVLDSPLLNADDIDEVRTALRDLLWHGAQDPELAGKVRELESVGGLSAGDAHVATLLYGIGGSALLHRHLDRLLDGGGLLWTAVSRFGRTVAWRTVPYRNEPDLVAPIGFRELNFAGRPDGLPLDPAEARWDAPGADVAFESEPFDLVAAMPGFTWPTVVVSGGRDLTTPPAVADRIAGLIPAATLVRLPTAGHSALDTREAAALIIAERACAGRGADLAAEGATLDALPGSRTVLLSGALLGAAARAEALLPGQIRRTVLPRLLGRAT